MVKKIKALSIGAAMVGLTCSTVFAAGYEGMSTEEMAGMRGTMQQQSQTERAAFQKEWQVRMQRMSTEEKRQYTYGGNGLGLQDGTGAQDKRSNRGSGAGAGMGTSGGGGGRGGRR